MKTEKRQSIFVILSIIFISFAMRAPMGGVGSLTEQIQTSLNLSSFVAGFLTTIPMVAFAVTSPIAGKLAVAIDSKLLLIGCLLISILGLVLRSYAGLVGLFVGTGLLGLSLGTMNVQMPALLRQRFPHKLGVMMGLYSTAMTAASAALAGASMGLSNALGGWEASLASPALLAVIAVLFCLLSSAGLSGRLNVETGSVGRCFTTRHLFIALFMGMQSCIFFSILAWFPSIMDSMFQMGDSSGSLLLLLQVCCLVPTFLVPIINQRCTRKDLLAFCSAIVFTVGFLIVLFCGGSHVLMIVGTVVLGLATGATMSLALALLAEQGRNAAETAKISGIAQCIGYTIAAFGPTGLGYIYDVFGKWEYVLYCMTALSVLMACMGLIAGRRKENT